MLVDRLVKLLLPREDHFFDLLEKGAAAAVRSGSVMVEICTAASESARADAVAVLKDVEHAADVVIHDVYDALNRTFVTPLDRSDIYALATQLEEIVDLNHAVAMQLQVHAMEEVPEGSSELARIISASTVEVQKAVALLRDMKQLDAIRAHCQRLSRLEHEGDEIYRERVGNLFKLEKNAVRLIQHKEFFEGLERAIDACDHTGQTLSAILIKNA